MFKWWHKIASAHRSDDSTARGEIIEFLFPKLSKGFFIRMTVVAAATGIIFGFFLMPCVIDGASMRPTYESHGFTFCKKWSYWFSSPRKGDIVIINYGGRSYLLKRIVALAGDTVEFRRGILYVNGEKQSEPYIRYASDWDLPPRTVAPGNCYVVGDNRSQRIHEHIFGQINLKRITGQPLF